MVNRSRFWTAICNAEGVVIRITGSPNPPIFQLMDIQRFYINKTPHFQETTQTKMSHKEVPVQNSTMNVNLYQNHAEHLEDNLCSAG